VIFAWHDPRSIVKPNDTTMLELHARQRDILAIKVGDIANLIVAALVIGFFVGDQGISMTVLVSASGCWLVAMLLVVVIAEGRK
jgi:hypothetical protein